MRQSGLNLCPSIVIPNGVNQDIFRHLNSVAKTDGITTILAVANKWEARKRPDIIIGIAERLKDNERLVIAGDTKGQFPSDLKNSTYIPTIRNYDDLVRLYNEADCTISASTNETYGMTIAESMACRVPVIVPAKSAMAEYVKCTDGIIVASPTADDFIHAIRYDMGVHRDFSPKAPYDRQDAVNRYMELFNRLIDESRCCAN